MEKINIAMVGTEKQISFANDIINKMVVHCNAMIAVEGRRGKYGAVNIEKYETACNQYAKWMADGAKKMGETFTAEWVIKNRYKIIEAANAFLARCGQDMQKVRL